MKRILLALVLVVMTTVALAAQPKPWRVPMQWEAQALAPDSAHPWMMNVNISQAGNAITVNWFTSMYVEWCQITTIEVHVWTHTYTWFPRPRDSWSWQYWSSSVYIPAGSASGTYTFTVDDGEYTDSQFLTTDLVPYDCY